jgi:pimeloyl-ACP methyl ester carboxylesterase
MRTRARFPTFLFFVFLSLLIAPDASADDCGSYVGPSGMAEELTFTVQLPVAPEYASDTSMLPDSIVIPAGRPIYALFVHGYTQNQGFNLLMCYNFAKRLMQDGAYVHYAWWNNLCREYMAGPLHNSGSFPGHSGLWGVVDGAIFADQKASPVEDYQFQSDAEAFLQAIRENNPGAIIIVVGHSMGGASVARLGTDTNIVLDILAPIDPVGNRSQPYVASGAYYNWTRYRIAHEDLETYTPPNPEKPRRFRSNVINLYHRYQKEFSFPMDYTIDAHFLHTTPPGGISTQSSVTTCGTEIITCSGYCCYMDGHGEIVGYRGMETFFESYPKGLKALGGWPTGRTPEDICLRRRLLMEMPYADFRDDWKYRPQDPNLCLVSEGLIDLYETMNHPPVADAGGDRTVAHSASGVKLDGLASTDPDNDDLTFTWRSALGEMDGRTATAILEPGTHEITLTVEDPSGHIDRDVIMVTVFEDPGNESSPATTKVGAHPNPFNAGTRVFFELEERQWVSLRIFDLQGRLVRTLEEGTFDQGRNECYWDARNDGGAAVASGIYFVSLRAGNRAEFSKIILLK